LVTGYSTVPLHANFEQYKQIVVSRTQDSGLLFQCLKKTM
jgi:hypothetical protein